MIKVKYQLVDTVNYFMFYKNDVDNNVVSANKKQALELKDELEKKFLLSGYELTVSNKRIAPEEINTEESKTEEQKPQQPKPQNQNTEIQKTEEPIIEQQVEMQKQIVSEGIKTGDGIIIYFILNIISTVILIIFLKRKLNN